MDGGLLGAAIGQVGPAASRDDTLPMLTGVCLDIDGDTLTLAATDRYRLAVRDVPLGNRPRPACGRPRWSRPARWPTWRGPWPPGVPVDGRVRHAAPGRRPAPAEGAATPSPGPPRA